jgi:hypothetical protein
MEGLVCFLRYLAVLIQILMLFKVDFSEMKRTMN